MAIRKQYHCRLDYGIGIIIVIRLICRSLIGIILISIIGSAIITNWTLIRGGGRITADYRVKLGPRHCSNISCAACQSYGRQNLARIELLKFDDGRLGQWTEI